VAGRERYDAIVIGAGPAGSIAALRLAEAGHAVLLVEKRERIGHPVRCAEATGSREEIGRFVPIDEGWIAGPIDGARFVSPSGDLFEKALPGIGVVLDRERFDAGLAAEAAKAGADVRSASEATGLLFREGRPAGVRLRVGRDDREEGARLIVGADGVESSTGRWAGLPARWRSDELFSCFEARVRSAKRRGNGYLEFYFGSRVAPGGYGWAFPRGGDSWNVGLGVDPARARRVPARVFFDRFLESWDSGAEITGTMAGAACRSRAPARITGAGILLTGDAAHQGNPLTGGGIMNALEAGDLAGRIGAEALSDDDLSARRLGRYEKEWRVRAGAMNDRYLRLANLLYRKYDDDEFGRLWPAMNRLFRRREEGEGFFVLVRDYLAFPWRCVWATLPILLHDNCRRSLL